MRYDIFLRRDFIGDHYFFGAAGHHRFQLFGTHHRAQSGPSGGAAVIGHDAGNQR